MKFEGDYCTHTTSPMDPICSQLNPVHVLKAYFFKIHINSINLSNATDMNDGGRVLNTYVYLSHALVSQSAQRIGV
jgi:hypothetical protein